MARTSPRPAVIASALGVAGVVLLAGCSGPASTKSTTPASNTKTTAPATQKPSSKPTKSTKADAASAADSSKYKDGTFTADGAYSPKAGLVENVSVTLTLKNNVVTDVAVKGNPKAPESVEYQGKFIGGIKNEVVGKSLDDIKVSRVAGSSLTSGGFNKAVDLIKAEATA